MKRPSGAALLLSQLGSHVSSEFARRLAPYELTPSHVGVLRVLAQEQEITQTELARRLGATPSRVVRLIDELDARRLVRRGQKQDDRRYNKLFLDPGAERILADVRDVVADHDREIVKALTKDELATLLELLEKIAAAQGIAPQGHPGYRARTTDSTAGG